MSYKRFLLTCLLGLVLCGGQRLLRADPASPTPPQPVAATQPALVDIRETVTYLASDELEGRGPGTEGINKAADRIAGDFKTLKLLPAPGFKDYFQHFTVTVSTRVGSKSTLSAGDGKKWNETIEGGVNLDRNWSPLSYTIAGEFSGPVVFVGYAITAKHHNYDDFEKVDLKGKVALAFRFEPTDEKGASLFTGKKGEWSDNAGIPTKAKLCADHGAVALILVNPPSYEPLADPISSFAHTGQVPRASIPVIQVKRPVAEAMLKDADAQSLDPLEKQISGKGQPFTFPLKDVQASGNVVLEKQQANLKNVVAVLPGAGPHADEYIVIGAHYDHLGRGGPGSLAVNSHAIHHGADDNASGTTAVLKLAEEMSRGPSLDRSVIFITFSGEELGLFGSAYFVAHPPVALNKIVAMLNLDMVGRVREEHLQVGGSGTAAEFEKILTTAAEGTGLKLNLNSKGGMGPSDHASFAMKKIPVLFFFSGMHMDYHRPTDTADKINVEGIQQVVTLVERCARAIDKLPKEQYVGDFDSKGLGIMISGGGGDGPRAALGVMPDYSDDNTKGVRITGTVAGSAAEKAGLKDGDIILTFGTMTTNNAGDLMTALIKSKPGETVKLKVLRGKETIELQPTLTEKK